MEELAEQFIAKLKREAYGRDGVMNCREGDYGTWDDWKRALIEFAEMAKDSGDE